MNVERLGTLQDIMSDARESNYCRGRGRTDNALGYVQSVTMKVSLGFMNVSTTLVQPSVLPV